MSYVSARGGEDAIQHAETLYHALKGGVTRAAVQQIQELLPYLVDRVMGEASLYAPELAALALAQSGGDVYESVLLLRAFRSTQPRLAYAQPITQTDLFTIRRISASFKDVPGGQVLGPTLDYSHRILQLDVLDADAISEPTPSSAEIAAESTYPAVAGWLREQGLLDEIDSPEPTPDDPADIPDLTRGRVSYPGARAHRLQALARADTGGITSLGYASMRGYGFIHPTVNELRLAYADVQVKHPITGETFSAGRVKVSQTEVVSKIGADLAVGFAATLGWNEVKTIAAATLDIEMNQDGGHPAHTEDFVLYHTEPVESSGFTIHFKLPHYVTFASNVDTLRRYIAAAQSKEEIPVAEDEPEAAEHKSVEEIETTP